MHSPATHCPHAIHDVSFSRFNWYMVRTAQIHRLSNTCAKPQPLYLSMNRSYTYTNCYLNAQAKRLYINICPNQNTNPSGKKTATTKPFQLITHTPKCVFTHTQIIFQFSSLQKVFSLMFLILCEGQTE